MYPNNKAILLFTSAALIFKLKVHGIIFSQLDSIQARLYEKGQQQARLNRWVGNFKMLSGLKLICKMPFNAGSESGSVLFKLYSI